MIEAWKQLGLNEHVCPIVSALRVWGISGYRVLAEIGHPWMIVIFEPVSSPS